jgi:hypothetical protein
MSDCSGNVICKGNTVDECGMVNCCKLISECDKKKCCEKIEKIKLYSQEECASIDGIWHANGECTKKTGGSYSWDNRTTSAKLAEPKLAEPKLAEPNQKLGKPCPDGRIQLYTKDECDVLGGTWYANGECLKKTGGSYSWDNRPANSKPAEYNVQISLNDANHEYKMAKSVTVSDSSGNVLYTTDPVLRAQKLNGVSLAGGLKDK